MVYYHIMNENNPYTFDPMQIYFKLQSVLNNYYFVVLPLF